MFKTIIMILIDIDKQKKIPVYQQIYIELKRMISESTLQAGDRLPSSRQLALSLGVNRSTIIRAYEELWTEGYLESRPGSYSIVRQRKELVQNLSAQTKTTYNWQKNLNIQTANLIEKLSNSNNQKIGNHTISFQDLSPDNRFIPIDEFRKSINYVLRNNGEIALQYGHAQGYEPLREILAKQMNKHNLSIHADEIIITNGAQDGINLIIRALAKPGSVILTENPGYPNAHLLFKYSNAKVIGIPMERDGINLDVLEKQIRKHCPVFIYTMPNFQNPTGITTSQIHREKLLNIAEKYRVPLIEDGFEEEMKYYGKAALPIKSMDSKNQTIYLGTFSKVLFPGIRIGWVAGNKQLIHALTDVKRITDISSNYLAQVALEHYLSQGKYEIHLRKLHKEYRKRMQVALQTINQLFPEELVEFTNPIGGYLIWGKLKDQTISETKLIQETQKQLVAITPGSKFFLNEPKNCCFRLSIAHLDERQIEEGLIRFKKSINNIT